MPGEQDLPSTLRRSPHKAQHTYVKAHDAALEQYGEAGGRARRVAFAAVKHSFEKVGDRWQPKPAKGPSDTSARRAGGVNATASREHLRGVARDLNIAGRSTMTKPQLVAAIEKANADRTRRARS